eukprot:c39463_g1_i1.p1 GENE.c39463_g1_i1~~c39463_g1_i1.p1  ORF type:complete len:380 (-),score=46.89 c39463_g1_i1:23-1162(-)
MASGLDVFCLPMCLMHFGDHGNFEYVLSLCVDWAKQNRVLSIFDDRFGVVGKFPGMKAFKSGVSELTMVTAQEHRCIAMALPFVLNGIGVHSSHVPMRAAVLYLEWRILLSLPSPSVSTLEDIARLGSEFQSALDALSLLVDGKKLTRKIKFHQVGHCKQLISEFGAFSNYNSETFESAHKVFVKQWRAVLNRSNLERELLTRHALENLHFKSTLCDDETHQLKREVFRDFRALGPLENLDQRFLSPDVLAQLKKFGQGDHLIIHQFRKLYIPSSCAYAIAGIHSLSVSVDGRVVYGLMHAVIRTGFQVAVLLRPYKDVSDIAEQVDNTILDDKCSLFVLEAESSILVVPTTDISCIILAHPDFRNQEEPHFFVSCFVY